MVDYRTIRQGWKRVVTTERLTGEATHADSDACETSPSNGTFILAGATFEGTLSLTGDFHIDTEYGTR